MDLVMAACQGERSAYAVLVRRYYNQVFLVCLGVVGNVHDAEDVAQETMIKGLEKIRQLRNRDQFGWWIVKIGRNLCINHLRRRASVERLPVLREDESCGHDAGTMDLHEAVARLPWDLRLPLVMYYFDGRSVKAVADTLEISTSGVYAKLREALKELHDTLATQGDRP
jgi:RNA polymerase sigma-70 factor (ECF subfamily)